MAETVLRGGIGPVVGIGILILQAPDGDRRPIQAKVFGRYGLHLFMLPESPRFVGFVASSSSRVFPPWELLLALLDVRGPARARPFGVSLDGGFSVSTEGAPGESNTVVLSARDVRKTFDAQVRLEVLKGISLDFREAEFASIVGPSGSGKSTLLYILGALDRATSGSVSIGGRALEGLSQAQLALLRNRMIGFVFQFHFLLPEFSAVENVMMPALIGGARREDVEPRARELLERFDLAHRIRQRSTRLSGGEQQRVAIARALINRPRIVLCDEPTGNLDSKNSATILELFRELNREQRQTIIVVTHDTEFAARTDRTIHMLDGQVDRDERNPPVTPA